MPELRELRDWDRKRRMVDLKVVRKSKTERKTQGRVLYGTLGASSQQTQTEMAAFDFEQGQTALTTSWRPSPWGVLGLLSKFILRRD